MEVYTVNAFAKRSGGGNGAGVVPDASGLTEEQMQSIAKLLGFSETAFVSPSARADLRLRFFTPAGEVPLCGHATIGTFSVLGATGRLDPGEYIQETGAGCLRVRLGEDGTVLMEQSKPVFSGQADREAIARSLCGSAEELLNPELDVEIVSTGLRDILVPVRSREVLWRIRPDFQQVSRLSRDYDVVGYHLFTEETLERAAAHCRNLAPLYGIPEEAATGTSTGALCCCLFRRGRIGAGVLTAFEQGYSMDRPSEILACVQVREKEIQEVWVGGRAMDIEKREL
ncbi:PhzF family phenazine biosynthesis protein [Oscillibacter sp. MSJ-2]|uniref:PhzF family phenazine biosynthesis protein n=1 Tax=Dysosmobacter acutus TaxID=2841504 RepID=A0ABS6F4W1_9FIRM|nr:PhzF family phenazine biosynthesis protein [Dysosmobacter acutus]MBU5625328.1 PhzF family phenazine biosynthesis protein [Dysosmobacter acutus]